MTKNLALGSQLLCLVSIFTFLESWMKKSQERRNSFVDGRLNQKGNVSVTQDFSLDKQSSLQKGGVSWVGRPQQRKKATSPFLCDKRPTSPRSLFFIPSASRKGNWRFWNWSFFFSLSSSKNQSTFSHLNKRNQKIQGAMWTHNFDVDVSDIFREFAAKIGGYNKMVDKDTFLQMKETLALSWRKRPFRTQLHKDPSFW